MRPKWQQGSSTASLVLWLGAFKSMAERVGFEALNVEPCNGLHALVQAQETRHLPGFQFSLDLNDLF
jgi:hypothetical protein